MQGPPVTVDLSVYCYPGQTPPADQRRVTLPLTLELPDLCSYGAGHHQAAAELSLVGQVIAADRAIIAATRATIPVQKGDVLLFGSPATEPTDKKITGAGIWRADKYNTDSYLAYVPAIGEQAGVYAPFFGEGLRSWDDSAAPMGSRYFWGHVELATVTGDYANPTNLQVLVLRPTAAMQGVVDTLAAADKHPTVQTRYSQPFVGVFLHWLKWAAQDGTWYDGAAGSAFWNGVLGFDLSALALSGAMQFAPQLAPGPYSDIAGAPFWERDIDCSSLTMWSLIWGWQKMTSAAAGFFRDNVAATASIDALSPGQVAWWLHHVGFVTVED